MNGSPITRVRALVVKEILALLRDKKNRIVLIGPPLIQLMIFSFAATFEVENVTLAVLQHDAGGPAVELLQRFAGAKTFAKIERLESEAELARTMDTRGALAALVIPENFSRDILAGRQATLQMVMDGRRSNSAQIVQGYAARIVDGFSRDIRARQGLPNPPIEIAPRNWFNENLENIWFTVPNLVGLLSMVIGLVVTSLSVARERELGTFDQLLVTPLSPLEILAGKTLPSLVVGTAEGSLIVTAALFAFGVPFRGSAPLLYLGLVVFLASIVGFGLFISSLAQTQQQAILGAFTFLVPAVLLSGFSTPVENMPAWLQVLSYADPLRYFLVIVKGVFLKAMPFSLVAEQLWPMLLIAAATLTGAGLFFRGRLE